MFVNENVILLPLNKETEIYIKLRKCRKDIVLSS